MPMIMARSIRTTVSVPEELYMALAKAAEPSHVSSAWVIRDTLRQYLGGAAKVGAASAAGTPLTRHDARKAKTR